MPHSFDTLPRELISPIYKLLSPKDAENLSKASDYLKNIYDADKNLLQKALDKRFEHVDRQYWSTLSAKDRLQKIFENYEIIDKIIADVNARGKATTQKDELDLLLIAAFLDEAPLPANCVRSFGIPLARLTVLKGGLDIIYGMVQGDNSSDPLVTKEYLYRMISSHGGLQWALDVMRNKIAAW